MTLSENAVPYIVCRTKEFSWSAFHELPFLFFPLVRFKLSLVGSEPDNPHPVIHTVIANAQLFWYTELSH